MPRLYVRLLILFTVVFLPVLSCEKNADEQNNGYSNYKTFKDVPGVTAEEIAAIEEMQRSGAIFIYGMNLSSETFRGQNGEIRGYSALFCKYLSELFGVTFKPVIYDWNNLIAGLDNGTIDFTGEMTPTEERRKNYHMTDAITERSVKYFRIKNSMPFSQILETRMPRYAFLAGSITVDLVNSLEVEPFETIFVPNHSAVHEVLKSGAADAFIDEHTAEASFDVYGDIVTEDFFPLIYNPVSLTTKKAELVPIISVVQKMLQDGHLRYFIEMNGKGRLEYVKAKLENYLTEEEREYIRQHQVIYFATEIDNYPISFYNKYENQWHGIAFDVLQEVEKFTGLYFKLIEDSLALSDLPRALENKEVSMISDIVHSKDMGSRFLWSKIWLMQDKYALISKAEFPNISMNEVLYMKVGLPKGTAQTELFKIWFLNHLNVVEYDNTIQAFEALDRGEIHLVMSSQNQFLVMTNYMERPGYKINVLFDRSLEASFGFNKSDPVLRSIMEKSLQYVDVKRISEQWTSKTYDYRIKIAQAKHPLFIGVMVLFLCVIVLLLVLYKRIHSEGKRLENLVQKRTSEIDEQRKLLEHMSMTDQLTGMPNRRNFDNQLNLEWRIAIRESSHLSLLMLDIDKFKRYNDKYGHQQGDIILQAIAKVIMQTVKRPGDFVARWGGEEFVVLLSNTNSAGALKIAETIRSNVENLNVSLADGSTAKVTISIGVNTEVPGRTSSLNTFISTADNELYKAKEMGRNKVFASNGNL